VRRLIVLAPLLLIAIACSHEPGPPPEVVHLDAPPIGDAGASPTNPAPHGPFASVDIPPSNGTCPQPVHPGWCNFRCRGYSEREASHHAQRIDGPKRYALGTCGAFKAFAEEDSRGGALLELFDGDELIAAQDIRGEGCQTFLQNDRKDAVKCTPNLTWHPSEGN
jgi:hypothetical protein